MPYSEMFKRKMIQRMTGPYALSASALSKKVDVSQQTLSRWLRNAGIETTFSNKPFETMNENERNTVAKKRPEDWSPEEKLKAVLEAASLSDDQLGAFLRQKGLHETHLQQWRLKMLNGLSDKDKPHKIKRKSPETKQIRQLEKEIRRKDKALAETAALLVLKKKVQEIWGDEDDDTAGKKGK